MSQATRSIHGVTRTELFVGLTQEILARGCTVRFRAAGTSMHPAIQDGEVVTIAPLAGRVERGDVLLCQHRRGPIAHRVISRRPDGRPALRLRGDNVDSCDGLIARKHVIGRVLSVSRDGSDGPVAGPGLGARARRIAGRLTSAPRRILRIAALVALACVIGTPVNAQMMSGSYVGDGNDSRQVLLPDDTLGFQPDLVIVKGDNNQIAVIRTSTMTGDNAKPMTGGTGLTADLVQSLTATGFTVGTDPRVNTFGTNYYFVAFKQATKRLKVGSYTGNGGASQNITGIGFSPEFVIVMAANGNETVFRSATDTETFNFANSAGANYITALGADGFSVNNNARVNSGGVVYHYIAWNHVPGTIDVGVYTGNAAIDGRDITTPGFDPEWVLIKADAASNAVHHPASLDPAADDSLYAVGAVSVNNRIQALNTDGFELGTHAEVNATGTVYNYIAFRRRVVQSEVLSGSYVGNNTDNRAITGLGFRPDLVLVKGDNGQGAVLRPYVGLGDLDLSKDVIDGTLAADRIQTIDPGGFTVGTDARVNANGVTYHWIAWKGGANEMTVGMYTGTGTAGLTIADVGFSPDFVLVGNSTGQMVFRNSAGTTSYNFSGTANANLITSLNADGFVVGNDARVNLTGQMHMFIAWDELAGKMDVGSYAGNGANNRNITGVGFQPEFAMTQSAGGDQPVAHSNAMGASTDTSHYFQATAHANNLIKALQSDGFQLGTNADVNASGTNYAYAAWARPALTAVRMESMQARQTKKGVTLQWRTGFEVDNLGFHVYREVPGGRKRLTKTLVAGSGLTVARGVEVNAARAYRWNDESPDALDEGVRYWIQDVDLNGKRTWHGPIAAKAAATTTKKAAKTADKPAEAAKAEGAQENAAAVTEQSAPDPADSQGASTYEASSGLLDELTTTPQPLEKEPAEKKRETPRSESQSAVVDWPWYMPLAVASQPNTAASAPADTKKAETPAPATVVTPAPASSPVPDVRSVEQPSSPTDSSASSKSSSATRAETVAKLAKPPAPTPLPPGRAPRPYSIASGVRKKAPSAEQVRQWAIASGPAIKVGIREAGWYRIDQPALAAAGLEPTVDARTLQLFVDGVEQPLFINGEADGRLDAGDSIEFFATGADTPETDTRVYWIVAGGQEGLRLSFVDGSQAGSAGPASFTDTREVKERTIFFAALMNGDKENFFGPVVMEGETTEQVVALPGLDAAAAGDAYIEVALQGVAEPGDNANHRVAVSVNGKHAGEVVFDGRSAGVSRFAVAPADLVAGDNTVALEARGGEMDVSLLDYVRIAYPRAYRAVANELAFSADGGQEITVAGFTSSAIQVVDVTGDVASNGVVGTIAADGAGWKVTLTVPGKGTRKLIAVAREAAREPASVRANTASTLHRAGQNGEVVMITHDAFAAALAPLKALRESQGLSVQVVNVEDVYDEFSFGLKTPSAIREFMVRASEFWRKAPRYALLVGNATVDPRDYLAFGDADFVPTRVVKTGVMEAASDDWFVDSDDDGFADLAAIGRLPSRTAAQAAVMVAKIVGYEATSADAWRKSVMFIADRDDTGLVDYKGLNDKVSRLVPEGYQVSSIQRGVDADPGAMLKTRWNDGAFLVNYHGHGSVSFWQTDLLTVDDVPLLTNGSKLPIVLAMNCFNGFFTDVYNESLAATLVRAPNGGAVGVWASSGITSSAWQTRMDQELFRQIFKGRWRSIGDAMRAAKQVVGDPDVRRTWIYFGDPAMQLVGVPESTLTEVATATESQESPSTPGSSAPDDEEPAGDSDEESLKGDEGDHNTVAGVRLVDFDRDGRDDAFLVNPQSGVWFSALGGPGGFLYSAGQWTVSGEPLALEMNGDGLADLFVYDPNTGAWLQALSLGNGSFATRSDKWIGGYRVGAGDFDGDGRDDVFGVDAQGRWFEALSRRNGEFAFVTGDGLQAGELRVADFNADRRADVFVYDPATGGWTLMLSGPFEPAFVSGNWGAGWQPVIAYLNGDARADLVLWHASSGNWVHCISEKKNTFVYRSGAWTPGGHVHPLDINGDGSDELLRYDAHTGEWTMMATAVTGQLMQSTGLWEVGWTLAPGDLDADGRDDLLLYNADTGQWVRRLTRDGRWTDETSGTWSPGWSVAGQRR